MLKEDVKWCCAGFHGNYDRAGQRGMGILVGTDYQGRPEFTLQSRAIDKEHEQSVKPTIASLQPSIVIVVDVGMRYCPWCGRDLEKWYGDAADALFRPDLKTS